MDRGEVYVAPFAYADAEHSKPRPVCVVSTGDFNDGPDVVVAMITSSGRRLVAPGPGDVILSDWQEAGLLRPSILRAGRLQAIASWRLSHQLGRLSDVDLAAVDEALRSVLGLP